MEPFLGELSFGLTLKLLGGGYGEVVETSGVLEVLPTGAELDELQGLAQFGGGIGFGIDLGLAGVTRDRRTTFGLSVLNLLDVMTWGIAAEQDSFYAAASGLRVTRLLDVENLWDILDKADLNGDGVEEHLEKVGEESFSRSLPALVRLGVSHRPMPRLTLLANYDQALSEGFGLTTTPRASFGAEYRLLPWFPARSGISWEGAAPAPASGSPSDPSPSGAPSWSSSTSPTPRGGAGARLIQGLGPVSHLLPHQPHVLNLSALPYPGRTATLAKSREGSMSP